MSVKRYEFELYHCNGGEMLVSDAGDYVSYEDYAALEARCAALAAENAGLKNALEWLYEAVSMPDSGPIPDKYYSAVTNAAAVMHETPATDASLAEVRAQGVDMLLEHPAIKLCSLTHVCDEFAAQLRKGVQS